LGGGIANGLQEATDSAGGWLREKMARDAEEKLTAEEGEKRGGFAKLPGAQELIMRAFTGGAF
jgi:hypothetical protein